MERICAGNAFSTDVKKIAKMILYPTKIDKVKYIFRPATAICCNSKLFSLLKTEAIGCANTKQHFLNLSVNAFSMKMANKRLHSLCNSCIYGNAYKGYICNNAISRDSYVAFQFQYNRIKSNHYNS